jgi:hypothetical protein
MQHRFTVLTGELPRGNVGIILVVAFAFAVVRDVFLPEMAAA